ncbi:NADPH-dependent reductase BacG [compost metagenome]
MLLPGSIMTDRLKSFDAAAAERSGRNVDEVRAASERAIPARRYGTVEEFAATAAFLCSAPASYVTGSLVRCDGGAAHSV